MRISFVLGGFGFDLGWLVRWLVGQSSKQWNISRKKDKAPREEMKRKEKKII